MTANTSPAVIGTNTVVIGQTNLTVTIQVYYQAMMVDATALTTVVPVVVYDLIAHSPNTVVNDNMTLVQNLLVDGTSFTLNGNINIPGAIPPNPITGIAPAVPPLFNWAAVNAPNILSFTNNGSLTIFNSGHFGDNRSSPYTIFRNAGAISAGSIDIRSLNYQNSGSISSLFGTTFPGWRRQTGKRHQLFRWSNDVLLSQSVKLDNSIDGRGRTNLSVSNALFDAGPGSGSTLQSQNGINLLIKPHTGDLFGNHIAVHDSGNSARRQGRSPLGGGGSRPEPGRFTDNVAIGTLSLSSQSPDPLFFFAGTGAHNAMYVDVLDLSSGTLTDYTNQIAINNNLIIYYAAARLQLHSAQQHQWPAAKSGGIPGRPVRRSYCAGRQAMPDRTAR